MATTAQINAQYGLTTDTDNNGLVSGTAGNDKIVMSHAAGVDAAYGGAGNDTFIFKAGDLLNEASAGKVDKVIYDFEGAGGWSATGNDFLAFTGFSAGSTLTINHSLGINGVAGNADGSPVTTTAQSYYYTLHDAATNHDTTILIKSINGAELKAGDYAFYA